MKLIIEDPIIDLFRLVATNDRQKTYFIPMFTELKTQIKVNKQYFSNHKLTI
jgi:hypothetical protein